MPVDEAITEKEIAWDILRYLPRRPAIDRPADVELVDFDPGGTSLLAVTADGLCEEIATGLYADPYTIGWVLVMAAASDLAAAGASPIGITPALGLPEDFGPAEREALGRGIGDACRSIGTVTLGGDTNVATDLTAAAFAVGLVGKERVMTRVGAESGDALYLSGRAGLGNAYALARFDPRHGDDLLPFLPRARLEMGRLLPGFASCTMDTSDGVIATLDELSRTNGVGFAITAEPASFLHRRALAACKPRGIPPWLALAGCHGEFELAFTIPAVREEQFLAASRRASLRPKCIGRVIDEPGVFLAWTAPRTRIDSAWIRNLRVGENRDVRSYIHDLVEYARGLGR